MLRMTPRRTLLAAIAALAALTLPAVVPHCRRTTAAETRTGFAFYDVDRLYDTSPRLSTTTRTSRRRDG